jgi:hypothetical protein
VFYRTLHLYPIVTVRVNGTSWAHTYSGFGSTFSDRGMTLRDPEIPPDAKTQVQRNVSHHVFYGNRTGPTRAQKIVCRCFVPERTRMHYVTHRSHRMQKHKFGVTCNSVFFMETEPVSLEHKK